MTLALGQREQDLKDDRTERQEVFGSACVAIHTVLILTILK